MAKYFVNPFGVAGDLTAIPDTVQSDGSVSYAQAWGPNYAKQLGVDPAAIPMPRPQMNQLFNDITTTLQQLYQNGVPLFITSAMNLGSPFPYPKFSRVLQTDGNIYESLVASNTDVPPSSKWAKVGIGSPQSYSASVYTETEVTVPTGNIATLLTFNLTDFLDAHNIVTFSTTTNAFTAGVTGKYRVSAAIAFHTGGAGVGGAVYTQIYKNGVAYQRLGEVNYYNSDLASVGSVLIELNAGDTVSLYAFTTISSNISTLVDTTGTNAAFPLFQMEFVGT